MTTKEIIKEIMDNRNYTSGVLAEKLGYKYASGVTERLRSDMRTSVLIRMLDTLDCELVVRSKLSDRTQWVLNGKEESSEEDEKE